MLRAGVGGRGDGAAVGGFDQGQWASWKAGSRQRDGVQAVVAGSVLVVVGKQPRRLVGRSHLRPGTVLLILVTGLAGVANERPAQALVARDQGKQRYGRSPALRQVAEWWPGVVERRPQVDWEMFTVLRVAGGYRV